MAETGRLIATEMERAGELTDPQKIISLADEIYNNKISIWDNKIGPEGLFDSIDEFLSQPAVENIGYKTPYPMMDSMYGSLLRNSNISVICARAGCGKTSFLNNLSMKVLEDNPDLNVLH